MLDQRWINKISFPKKKKKSRMKYKIICAIFLTLDTPLVINLTTCHCFILGKQHTNVVTSMILCIKIRIRKLFDEFNSRYKNFTPLINKNHTHV